MARTEVAAWAGPMVVAAYLFTAGPTAAETARRRVPIDRVVVRYTADELGGARSPRFITARVLAFEARLEALGDARGAPERGYRRRHIRMAMERHIAETVLAQRRIEASRAPSPATVARETDRAEALLIQRAGGVDPFRAALKLEGLSRQDLLPILRRRARASIYLDVMVTRMLRPSAAELRRVHRIGRTPYRGRPFQDVRTELESWLVMGRLRDAVASFYEELRGRVRVHVVPRPGSRRRGRGPGKSVVRSPADGRTR